VHIHKSSRSGILWRRLLLLLVRWIILEKYVSEVELSLLSYLGHVWVETEHDVLEAEDRQRALLVVEGSTLLLLKRDLGERFQILSHVTVAFLDKNFFFTRNILLIFCRNI
jgi:hypothetical protein